MNGDERKDETPGTPTAEAIDTPVAPQPWVTPTLERIDLRDAMALVAGGGDGGASS